MFITRLTKDPSCFSLIEKANNDPGILALDDKTRKNSSGSYLDTHIVYSKYYLTLYYIFTGWKFPASKM